MLATDSLRYFRLVMRKRHLSSPRGRDSRTSIWKSPPQVGYQAGELVLGAALLAIYSDMLEVPVVPGISADGQESLVAVDLCVDLLELGEIGQGLVVQQQQQAHGVLDRGLEAVDLDQALARAPPHSVHGGVDEALQLLLGEAGSGVLRDVVEDPHEGGIEGTVLVVHGHGWAYHHLQPSSPPGRLF